MSVSDTDDLALLTRQLEELNRIGAALSAERDTSRLLDLILSKAREITGSDAGSLYVVDAPAAPDRRVGDLLGHPGEPPDDRGGQPERPRLRFMIAQNDSVTLPFKEQGLDISEQSIAGYVALTGRLLNIHDAYDSPPAGSYTFNPSFDRAAGYRTRSVLAAPLRTPQGHIVGVIELINARPSRPEAIVSTPGLDAVPFTARHEALLASLAAQAAVALDNSRLYASIQRLFEGFVRASVVAIESRDPATSGHSFRVANLTVALAESVDRSDGGPFAAVRFSRDQMRTIRYASLLHDFGKVGVREEVLVKAKKLYPGQLAVIRDRFALARRSREIASLRKRLTLALADGPEAYRRQEAAFDTELQDDLQRLSEYLDVVERANEPTPVPHGDFGHLHAIARAVFDDGEAERPLLSEEEVTWLSLRKGSLSEAERAQIESHVAHTYSFLRQIPWTDEIRDIPSVAYGHHELLNGRGYPRRLSAPDIPIQTRMMTICDIFDALSAADRPYKKAVPIERALGILRAAVDDGELDRDLFGTFVDARIFDRWHEEPFPY